MQHCRARYCTCNVAAISISFILWGCGCRDQPIRGGSALWHLWGSVVFYARRRRRAEEERTTSTGGVCGFSGPQSRLGLVRANPPLLPQFRIQIKNCLVYSYEEAGLSARIVCQPEDTGGVLVFCSASLPFEDDERISTANLSKCFL